MKEVALRFLAAAGRRLRHTRLGRSNWLNKLASIGSLWLHGEHEVNVGEFRVTVHPDDWSLARRLVLYGEHEPAEIAALCSYVEEGDTALDVGANIGLFTLHLSRAVGAQGRVIAVEPDPTNAQILRQNLHQNQCRNVTLLQMALGSRSRTAKLFIDPHHRAAASLAEPEDKSGRVVEVPVRRAADVIEELDCPPPRIVKIDVEGAEPEVFDGLGFRPEILLLECVPEQYRALSHDPVEFLKLLQAHGYSLYLFEPEDGIQKNMPPSEIVAAADKSQRNVLALRS